jgi:glucans biosynthesis protein C
LEAKKERLHYLENLRVALMVLVILQHAVRAYGSSIWWFVKDGSAPLLERFTAVNSSFFMSLFFAISFYFLPASYDRKGFGRFHADRLLRLFVPLVAYVACVSSAMMYAYFILSRGYGSPTFPEYFRDYFLGFAGKPSGWQGPSWPDANLGHLWFIEHLLLYGLVYSTYRLATGKGSHERIKERPFPSSARIALFALGLAALSFAVRLRFPLYKWIGLFGFIQTEPAHLPFYLSMFVIGIAAYRHDWLASLPGKTGKTWLAVGIASAIAIALHPAEPRFYGGFAWQALEYALLETFACLGLIIGLPYFFWRYANRQGTALRALSANSYLVYILHLPIVVAFQYCLQGIAVDPYVKFAIVSILSIPATFLLSHWLRKLPYIRTYL